jgi:hypothetical protein
VGKEERKRSLRAEMALRGKGQGRFDEGPLMVRWFEHLSTVLYSMFC